MADEWTDAAIQRIKDNEGFRERLDDLRDMLDKGAQAAFLGVVDADHHVWVYYFADSRHAAIGLLEDIKDDLLRGHHE